MISNKLKKIKLNDIKPYKNNVKVHTPEQIQAIKKSIEDNGYIQKICVDKDNVIVIGHGRYFALKEMDIEEIEVVDLSGYPAEKIKKLRILDNKLNESEWDFGKLEKELRDMYGDLESELDNLSEIGIDQEFLNTTLDFNALLQKEGIKNELLSVNIDNIKRMFDFDESSNKIYKTFFWYIKNRKTIQWGGLADEFDEYERKYGITLKLLKIFKEFNYPVCFSTKGVWWIYDDRYRKLFKDQDNWNMKFSIINLDPRKSRLIEKGCPSPQDRLKAIKEYTKLNKGGVTLRLRPFIIGLTDKNDEYLDLIKQAKDNGATAISTEFFCLERRASKQVLDRYNKISEVIGLDIYKFYARHSIGSGYSRLNRKVKEPYIKKMYDLCNKIGLRFYVSDAHFKEYCHNGSCCGLPRTWNYSKGQFTEALLIAKEKGKVYFSDISGYLENYKKMGLLKPIKIYHSSNSKENAIRNNQSIYDYFREMWNSPNSAKSPYKYFGGILIPIGLDKNKDVIYEYKGDNNGKKIK